MIRTQKKINDAAAPVEKLSTEESIIVGSKNLLDRIQENRTRVYTIVGIVVAIGVGIFLWREKVAENEEAANVQLARISSVYQSANWRMAIDGNPNMRVQGEPVKGLSAIVSEYGSTKAGNMAKLYLANCYYFLGKLDSAMAVFQDISPSGALVKASVWAGKGAILEEKGNKAEAAKLFKDAAEADKANPLNADYALSAARNFEQAGDKEQAVKIYRQILEEYPGTYFDDAAKRGLIRLQAD